MSRTGATSTPLPAPLIWEFLQELKHHFLFLDRYCVPYCGSSCNPHLRLKYTLFNNTEQASWCNISVSLCMVRIERDYLSNIFQNPTPSAKKVSADSGGWETATANNNTAQFCVHLSSILCQLTNET